MKADLELTTNTEFFTLILYFVNAQEVCRVQEWNVIMDGMLVASGEIADFQNGKHVVLKFSDVLLGSHSRRLKLG